MTPYQIISLRPDSIVVRIGDAVDKIYLPRDYPEWNERYASLITSDSTDNLSYLSEQKGLFNHEAAIVKALDGLDRKMIPPFLGADNNGLKIRFQYLPHSRYQDAFIDIWNNEIISEKEKIEKVNSLTQEMVLNVLVPFHNYCNDNMQRLVRYSRIGGKQKQRVMLKLRNPEDRTNRLSDYVKSIMSRCSTELEQYWNAEGINPEELTPREIRTHIGFFRREKRYNIVHQLAEVEKRDRIITGREAVFVAGDFGPHNIFRTSKKETIYAFDFDKACRGSRNIDLCHVIYNIHRYPFHPDQEAQSLNLAAEYFRKVGLGSEVPERVASFVASGMLEALRFWAIYCQMIPDDIRKFVGNREPYRKLDNNDLRQRIIGEMFPQHFRDFFEYYRYRQGEGWEEVLEKPLLDSAGVSSRESRKNLLENIRQQTRTIEDILTEMGCLQGKAANQTRARKIQRIFTVR